MKIWKFKYRLSKIINKAESKLASAVLGFPLFLIRDYSEINYTNSIIDTNENSEYLHYQYKSEKLKYRLAKIFQKKFLFQNWKEIALSKRVDFPYNFYNMKLAKNAFKGFIIILKKRWVTQKNNIM